MRGSRGFTSRRDPAVPRVQKVEVSEKNIKLRVILIVVFLVIGIVALTVFVASLLQKEEGWREIEADSSAPALSAEFVLQYQLGSVDSPTIEYRAISEIYSREGSEWFALLDCENEYQNMVNLYTLLQTPNQVLTVDPRLYRALESMVTDGGRLLYLQPLYSGYESLFFSGGDAYAALRDPYRSEDAREEIAGMMHYCSNPDMIRLELLGENRVCLHVAQEYLTYAEQNAVGALIGFGWLKNAFIIDGLADALSAAGYVYGHLTSYDGYTRNLDTASKTVYGYHYFDRCGNGIYDAATFHYTGDIAVVDLRAFWMREMDSMRLYTYMDGAVATLYVDPSDGYYRYANNGLLAYSDTNGCAEIALRIAPIYLADTLDTEALAALKTQDIDTIYSVAGEIRNSGDGFALMEGSLYTSEQMTYRYVSP